MPDILAVLIAERDKIERAIFALEGTAKRRGRPPGRASGRPPGRPARRQGRIARPGVIMARGTASSKRSKPRWTAAMRQAAAERMRKRWAAKKKK